MKVYDLSVTLEPKDKVEAFGVEIKYSSHQEGGKAMLPFFNCTLSDLPGEMLVRGTVDTYHPRRHAH